VRDVVCFGSGNLDEVGSRLDLLAMAVSQQWRSQDLRVGYSQIKKSSNTKMLKVQNSTKS